MEQPSAPSDYSNMQQQEQPTSSQLQAQQSAIAAALAAAEQQVALNSAQQQAQPITQTKLNYLQAQEQQPLISQSNALRTAMSLARQQQQQQQESFEQMQKASQSRLSIVQRPAQTFDFSKNQLMTRSTYNSKVEEWSKKLDEKINNLYAESYSNLKLDKIEQKDLRKFAYPILYGPQQFAYPFSYSYFNPYAPSLINLGLYSSFYSPYGFF